MAQISHSIHCLMLPVPAQGHMNPVLQFSKHLQHQGINPTLVTTKFMFNTTTRQLPADSISIETISDGHDDGGINSAESSEIYVEAFKRVGSETLAGLIEKRRGLGCPDVCLVYDPHLPWALDVAKKYGMLGVAFFTQSWAVGTLYYHAYHGLLQLPVVQNEINVPGLPTLNPSDLPSFLYAYGSYPVFLDVVLNQFSNLEKADWLLCNTFDKLEQQAVEWISKQFRFRAIGPLLPSFYLDKRIQEDKEYGISIHNPSTNACLNWLNQQEENSVVYVSFGSVADLGIHQMAEIAECLKGTSMKYLWVVRESDQAKIPDKFQDETWENGLVVSWCPQLEVLAHNAVGCFVTHCGWNSTLEALSLGVPMVVMPQWTDQNTNAKFVADVWGIGVVAEANEDGTVGKEAIESCIREVMEMEKGREIRRNASKWRELALEAVSIGGSSDRNIEEFVASLFAASKKLTLSFVSNEH